MLDEGGEAAWTTADVELVGDVLAEYSKGLGLPPSTIRPYGAAAAVLRALAETGRLIPPEATKGWALMWDDGYVQYRPGLTEEGIRALAASVGGTAVYQWAAPWQPLKGR